MRTTRLLLRARLVLPLALLATAVGRAAHAQQATVCAAPTADAARPSHSADLSDGAHEIVLNGVRLWYCVAGRGQAGVPPVLFLHGGPGYNSYSFAALAGPRLERGLRMVYLDQRGSGRSERPWTGHYATDTLVADVEALRAALGVRQVALIGHSFGGTLALEYAAAHPDRVARLVLVSAAADLPAACATRVAWLAAHYPADLARARSDTGAKAPADGDACGLAFRTLRGPAFEAYNNGVMFPDSVVGARQDSVDAASGLRNTGELSRAQIHEGLLTYRFGAFSRLRMPVLVLGGSHDSAIGLEPQQALAHALPNARFVEYGRGGHFLYLDEPQRFTRDVTAFLVAPPGQHAGGVAGSVRPASR